MPAPFDQRLANEAKAAEDCMKLGAVILRSKDQHRTGFAAPESPPPASWPSLPGEPDEPY